MILIDPSKIPLVDGPSKLFDDCPVGLTKEVIDILVKYCGVEAEPIKHGRWVKSKKSDYVWECSNCGYGLTDYRTTYCYDCGARMDEVGNGENK